jgi:hypothetical protein
MSRKEIKQLIYMKKTIITLTTIICGITANAQKGKFLIEAGYTFPNYTETVLKNLNYTIDNASSANQLNIGYFISDKISISAGLNVSSATTKAKDVYDNTGNYQFSYTYDLSLIAFLMHANYNYIANDKWNLSSGIGLGTAIANVKTTVTPSTFTQPNLANAGGLALHITAIDAKYYFNNWLGLHAKLGVGSEGIIGLGATFRLN